MVKLQGATLNAYNLRFSAMQKSNSETNDFRPGDKCNTKKKDFTTHKKGFQEFEIGSKVSRSMISRSHLSAVDAKFKLTFFLDSTWQLGFVVT